MLNLNTYYYFNHINFQNNSLLLTTLTPFKIIIVDQQTNYVL